VPLPLLAIGAGISGISSLAKTIFGGKQQKLANKIKPQWNQYQTSPYAQRQLAMAQQLFGGRMAGAGAQEQNIFNNQATTQASINRNAGDASRAIALAGGVQGQTNEALGNLGMQEAQNKYKMLGNLYNAYGQMVQEGDKVYQSQMQKYMMDKQDQFNLRNAGAQNMFGGMNDIAGLFGTLGMGQQQNSFWQNMFGGNKQTGARAAGGAGGGALGGIFG
jgi:hypothetical protein